MPKNTPNLNLYKVDPDTDSNDTFNIDLALNNNWDKIDAAIKEVEDAVGDISIPDASLTKKGITQLSSAIDGDREDRAATEKAVKAAYDRGSAGVTAAGTVQENLNTHSADSTAHVYYSDDTGTANAKIVAITPVPTVYKKGLAVAFTNLVQNTGAVTINVNGLGAKSILKSNGNALVSGNLKVNSIYTLRYNGTSFILQGEGGGGTAIAADLRNGKTAAVDVGDITGTMSDISLNGTTTTITAQGQTINIPAGYSDGTGKVTANYAPKGRDASGTVTSGTDSVITITGLSFTPRIVRVRSAASASPNPVWVLHGGVFDYNGISHVIFGGLASTGTGYGGDSKTESRNNITSNGFSCYVRTGNTLFSWEAEE